MIRLKTISDVVDWGLCIGCGACAYASKDGGVRMVHLPSEGFRPVFAGDAARASGALLEICPGAHVNSNLQVGELPKRSEADHEFGPTLEIWEGWATDPELRFRGSSGGVLSAVSLYCVEGGGFDGVVHAGMDPAVPWMNRNHLSRDREAILARAGSRYAPSAPCAALTDVPSGESHVFVGKPCDTAAVSELCARDADLSARIGLILTFFCAGTPSTRGTLDLMTALDVQPERVRSVHYRGEGWPGLFRVSSEGQLEQKTLTYKESWGRLTSYRPLRCNLCPDGLGRVADIACGDAWDQYEDNGDPGRSLVLVRTERGRAILEGARRAGYVTLKKVGQDHVLRAQVNLLERRRALFGRLAAFRLLGVPVPDYRGFSLLRSWLRIGPKEQFRSVLGTVRRILERGWFRKRRPHLLAAASKASHA